MVIFKNKQKIKKNLPKRHNEKESVKLFKSFHEKLVKKVVVLKTQFYILYQSFQNSKRKKKRCLMQDKTADYKQNLLLLNFKRLQLKKIIR